MVMQQKWSQLTKIAPLKNLLAYMEVLILVTNDQNCWKTESGKHFGLTPLWGSVLTLTKSIVFRNILCITLISVQNSESDFCVKYYDSDFWRQQYGAVGPNISLGTRKPPLSHQCVSINCAEKSKSFPGLNHYIYCCCIVLKCHFY